MVDLYPKGPFPVDGFKRLVSQQSAWPLLRSPARDYPRFIKRRSGLFLFRRQGDIRRYVQGTHRTAGHLREHRARHVAAEVLCALGLVHRHGNHQLRIVDRHQAYE